MKHLVAIFFTLCFFSCGLLDTNKKEDVIARVGDRYLTEKDIEPIVTNETTEDSLRIVEAFIDNWIKKELLLQKALVNLSDKQINFDEQLENYRNSLIIYAYENLLIKQKLDTLVRKREIQEYYASNKNNFKLKSQLLKVRFVKVLNSAPNKDSLKQWVFSTDEEYAIERLSDYCRQFANNCHLDSSKWLKYADIYKYLPKVDNLKEEEYNLRQEEVLSDTLSTVYLKLYSVYGMGEVAPMSYVQEEIKDIIRNKRKLKLLSKAREEIYEEATLKKKYEVYK